MVSATSRSSCAVPMRPATAATWASIHPAASTVRAGEVWMVASATSRARQAGTAPAWTCAHSRGRRWRSSRAWPMSFFAAVDEMPEDGAELGDAELRHQRTAGTGDGLLVLAAGDGERSSGVDRLRRVEIGPPGGDLEELRGGLVLRGLAVTSQREQLGGGEVLDLTCLLCLLQRVDHVFDYSWWHRQSSHRSTVNNPSRICTTPTLTPCPVSPRSSARWRPTTSPR